MKFIDVHAHVQFPEFDVDREEVIKRAEEASVGIINVGTDEESSTRAVKLATGRSNMWATVGLHPTDAEGGFDQAFYQNLVTDPKVVAIGECGLDYFRSPNTKEAQEKIFLEQIELANVLGKPLMLHVREAYTPVLEIIRSHAHVSGNVHFFVGDWTIAKQFLDLGFTLSFTGVITFTTDYDEVIRQAPLDMIMAETDCPFVAPAPYRGKRNEPLYVAEVVKRIAEIKQVPINEASEALGQNANRLFGLQA